ncbi:SPFH domain-containing protein [Streptomyces sp. NPDC058221]|uniref:SPFH domain-containing protein n=1 Tax=Streptomyces sp. NPDC058221 TaxID=3346388 RepID=UPI0036E663D8
MRSTVSDSSGNPGNGEHPEDGEERYGVLPVREWSVPEHGPEAGADASADAEPPARADAEASPADADAALRAGVSARADAWAGAETSARRDTWAGAGVPARAGARPDPGGPAGPRPAAGVYDWSAPGTSGASSVSEGWPRAGSASAPVPGAPHDGGSGARTGPDSVVDLVLDLMPGEGERGGSAFGATSASVSVPGAPAEAARPAADAAFADTPSADTPSVDSAAADSAAVTEDALPEGARQESVGPEGAGPGGMTTGAVPGPGTRSGRPPWDAQPGSLDLLPAPSPEKRAATCAPDPGARDGASCPEDATIASASASASASSSDPAPDADPAAREVVRDSAPEVVRDSAPDPEEEPFLFDLGDAPGPGRGLVPGPGAAPVRRDTGPSLSLSFGGADTGELRTEVRVDTGRRHSVIANERTASIPVHLLFRDDPSDASDAAALPATVVRRDAVSEQTAGFRRPPVPRTPQVRPSTRPAPVADPRLHERPGPALPGWVALLTGLGGLAAAGGALWWTGALPGRVLSRIGLGPRPYDGIGLGTWAALALLGTVVLFALGGLTRGRVGYAWVLTLFGQYRGSVRRTGLMWVSPLLLRRRVDVRLRHWRSEPLPAVDANGTALRVVVLVVWRVKDTVRATLGIADHEEYLREQVEAAMARVLSQLPADAFHEDAHTLRNAEAVGDALTRMLKADCEPVGIEVYSAQPTGIEYAPEVAAAMQRRRIAAIDAKHRDSVLTSVVDAVDDTVNRLTARGLVELDDYERKSLVKDLTVAFYTGRSGGDSA